MTVCACSVTELPMGVIPPSPEAAVCQQFHRMTRPGRKHRRRDPRPRRRLCRNLRLCRYAVTFLDGAVSATRRVSALVWAGRHFSLFRRGAKVEGPELKRRKPSKRHKKQKEKDGEQGAFSLFCLRRRRGSRHKRSPSRLSGVFFASSAAIAAKNGLFRKL